MDSTTDSNENLYTSLDAFFNSAKKHTDIYKGAPIGRAIYSALMLKKGEDERGVFRPRDLWEISNEDLISLIKDLEEYVRVQSKNN